MSIFGKDHYVKFCITTFLWQKMLKVNIMDQYSSQLDNTERIMIIFNYVVCQLCAVFMSTYIL